MKDKNLHIIQEVVANTCRFLLAASFIFSGFVKAVDPLGFQYKIQDYLTAFGMASWFPSFFPLLGGIILSAVEFFIGISLFFATRRTLATSLALMLMIFMTPLTLYLAIFDPVSDCGCFGDAWVLTNWETFGKNIVLLFAAMMAFRHRRMLVRFISVKMEWLVSLYTLFFVFTLSFYCLDRLPVLDFRPYKIGKNILDMAQCRENIAYYQENARIIADTLKRRNIRFFGGVHSPYIWFECPDGMESWEFFDYLLNNAQVVGTPGAGFGENGKNYFRLTSFNNHENTIAAMKRFEHLF